MIDIRNAAIREKRRARFSDTTGLERVDLPVAGEIWLRDLFAASWATREAMRLGMHLVRYMNEPDPEAVKLEQIENQCQLTREDVLKALTMMRNYGVVDAFSCRPNGLRVALHLSLLQRTAALELTDQFCRLVQRRRMDPSVRPPATTVSWLPENEGSLKARSVN